MTLRDQIKELAGSTTSKVRLTALAEVLALMERLPPDEPCRWTNDEDGVWETECGDAFVFTDGGPEENNCRFCCYCGRPLLPVKLSVCAVCCGEFVPVEDGQTECDPLGCPGRDDAEVARKSP